MNRLSLLAASIAFAVLPANAEVEPKIHRLCLEAKDYAGCVKAMTGTADSPSPQKQINQQGADIAGGNQCPHGFAYVGADNCQFVRCEYNSAGFNELGHDSLIAGKKDINGKDVWGCKYSLWNGAGVLRLSGGITRTTNNPKCPSGEPELGFNNTCQTKGPK